MKKSHSFQLWFILIATIFLIVILLAVSYGQIREYKDSKSHDFWYNKNLPFPPNLSVSQDSVWVPQSLRLSLFREKYQSDSSITILTYPDLLSLLKEYRTYCDTVTIYVEHWEYAANCDIVKIIAVSKPQKGTLMSVEGLMDWLENVKLK